MSPFEEPSPQVVLQRATLRVAMMAVRAAALHPLAAGSTGWSDQPIGGPPIGTVTRASVPLPSGPGPTRKVPPTASARSAQEASPM